MVNKLYEFMSFDKGNVILERGGPESKDLYLKGIFIQGEIKNQNQRVYPLNEIRKAVENVRQRLGTGESVLGELDHPEELTINLDRVSHMITDMWMEGNDGYGKLKLVPTPSGKLAETLLQSGVKLGVSSRGSGNVGYEGKVSEFEIVTVDIVAQPSAPNAYPKAIYESLFNMKGGGEVYRLARDSMHDPLAEYHLKKEIFRFIDELKLK